MWSLSECSIAFNISLGEIIERNFTVSVQAVNSVGTSNATTLSRVIFGRLLIVSKTYFYNSSYNLDFCDALKTPANGSVSSRHFLHPVGSEVTYHCDDGLLPTGVMTSTCTDVGGRGEWVPDPAQLKCIPGDYKKLIILHFAIPPS